MSRIKYEVLNTFRSVSFRLHLALHQHPRVPSPRRPYDHHAAAIASGDSRQRIAGCAMQSTHRRRGSVPTAVPAPAVISKFTVGL